MKYSLLANLFLWLWFTLDTCCFAFVRHDFRSYSRQRLYTNQQDLPQWVIEGNHRDITEIIELNDIEYEKPIPFTELLHRRERSMEKRGKIPAKLQLLSVDRTLNELSELYHFPVSHLGRWLMRLGVPPPIPKETPVRELVTDAEKQLNFMSALHTDEKLYQSSNFDNPNINQIAEEFAASGVGLDEILRICSLHELMLPFGVDSVLPRSEYRLLVNEIHKAVANRKDS